MHRKGTENRTPVDGDAREPQYWWLLSYVVSNAIAGEIMAVENYSELVPLMEGVPAKLATVKQAWEESKHIRLLLELARRNKFPVRNEISEPQWKNIRRHFHYAATRGDLRACLLIQDLMTETVAIVLYETLARAGKSDPRTESTSRTILADELEHRAIGAERLRAFLAADASGTQDALVWAHHRVMPELFSMISTSCHSLCGELALDCSQLTLASLQTDIESLRVQALDRYVESLDMVGFAARTTGPLIASLAACEGMERIVIGGKDGRTRTPPGNAGCCGTAGA